MRRRNIPMWLCGAALLCFIVLCAAPARSQSMDSQQANGEEVGASARADVHADVSANLNNSAASSSANFSGSGRASAATAYSGAVAQTSPGAPASHGRLARNFDALPGRTGAAARVGGSAIHGGKENERSAANRHSMLKSYRAARMVHGPQPIEATRARARLKSALTGANPGSIHGAAPEPVSYSDGFQDSTKGTALISPPDLGTAGPFAFNTELNFNLPDFANRQFLNPSLDVGGGSGSRKTDRRDARNRARTSAVSRPASPDEDLGLDVLRGDLGNGFASDPASDLGTTLSTSVHQQ